MVAAPVSRTTPANTVTVFHPTLGEFLLPLAKAGGGVAKSIVSAFPPKTVTGDFTRANHEVLSSLVQSDWIGGGQVTDSDEAVDINRYRGIATLETRYPKQVTLLPLVRSADAGATVLLLGDVADKFWVAVGVSIWRATREVLTDSTIDLDDSPVARGVRFAGTGGTVRLYVPQGTAGYQTWDGTAVGVQSTAALPLNFVVWDRRLWCVESTGAIKYSLDGAAWTTVLTADAGERMRGLVRFYDRADAPCINLVTDRSIQALDAAAPALYETEFSDLPPHPDAGEAFCRWNTDIYYAVGMAAWRYTFSVRTPAGLDRDHGVPAEYRGSIADLYPGHSDLFALVRGASQDVDGDTFAFDGEEDADLFFPSSTARSSLMRLDVFGGWHTLWASNDVGGDPAWIDISRADDAYRLYWAVGDLLYVTELSREFQNPKENPNAEFALSGRLESSKFDVGLAGSHKDLTALTLRTSDCTATEPIRVYLRSDHEGWHLLGTIEGEADGGATVLRVGVNGAWPDGTARYDGETFHWVQYAIEMDRDPADATKSPSLESVELVHRRIAGSVRAWSFTVDCSSDEGEAYGTGNRERQEFLEGLVSVGGAVSEHVGHLGLLHRDRWYSVFATGCSGQDETGQDLRGDRRLTLVESWEIG